MTKGYLTRDSTTARKGWSTPQIPSLFSLSVVFLALFVYYEHWREAGNKSVLVPMSMWRYPGARMGSIITLVFFAWYEFPGPESNYSYLSMHRWGFNTTAYISTL
jgi:hypothetical protein